VVEPGRRPRVLVVDDERAFADLLAAVLEDEGYAIDLAYDGEQALRMIQASDPPDLVLSDVMLPSMRGTELLAATRRLPGCSGVPFLLLSAGPDPGVQADRVDFMAKPLDLDRLLDQVEAAVAERQQAAPRRSAPALAASARPAVDATLLDPAAGA
jgi:CheY-like chemotaxis protein